MKITLTQSGGLLGRTRTATAEWPYTIEEFTALAKKISTKSQTNARDGYDYFLQTDPATRETPVSIKNIPEKYSEVFEELFNNLTMDHD